MRIFHIKSNDCSLEDEHRFADLVCALASIGIGQYVMMGSNEALESQFADLDVPFTVQKFGGLFDLRTQQAAQQIAESYGPHIIQTHSYDSAQTIKKLNNDAVRIGFANPHEETNEKNMSLNNLLFSVEYSPMGNALDYNVLPVPPLVANPGKDIVESMRNAYNTPDDAPLIGCMLDLTNANDLETVISSIRNISSLHFWILGSGPHKNALEEKARKQAVHDRVHFIENTHNWPGLLKALDICIVPFRAQGVERLTLEAWSCGCPVISAMPQERSPIEPEEDGLFVRHNDPVKWGEAIKRLLDDNDLREQIAQNGHETFIKSYCAEKIIGRYLLSYETALKIAA